MKLGYPLPMSSCWISVECWFRGTPVRRRNVDLLRLWSVETFVSRVRGATRRLFRATCGRCGEKCDTRKCDLAVNGVPAEPPFLGLESVVGVTWDAMTLEPFEAGKKADR